MINRITLSGPAGSGKSSIAKALSKATRYEFVSVGDYSREYSEEKFNMTINEFQEHCEKNPEIDIEIDKKFTEECNSKANIIIDYRLGFNFIRDSFNILLEVSDEVAFNRINQDKRESEQKDLASIKKRNKDMQSRFKKQYNVDFLDKNNYDLVINTDSLSIDAIIEKIFKNIQ